MSIYGEGSLKIVASELAKYNINLVTVQEVRWGNGVSQSASQQMIIHFSVETGMLIIT
jgi:hypothetical protein